MRSASKIRFFLFVTAIAIALNSCKNEKNDVIPDVYVNFTMDIIYDSEFSNLSAIGNHVIVTSKTNNWGISAAGYDDNGIIVYRSLPDEFNAYDRMH